MWDEWGRQVESSFAPPPPEQQTRTWEELAVTSGPGTIDMREAMYYTLSLPVSTAIIGCDSVAQLEENVRLAREFTPLSSAQMTALQAKTEPVSRQSLFFRFYSRA